MFLSSLIIVPFNGFFKGYVSRRIPFVLVQNSEFPFLNQLLVRILPMMDALFFYEKPARPYLALLLLTDLNMKNRAANSNSVQAWRQVFHHR